MFQLQKYSFRELDKAISNVPKLASVTIQSAVEDSILTLDNAACVKAEGITVVNLAYLDDSGTRQKDRKYQVMSGVIVGDAQFHLAEVISAKNVEDLLPADRRDQFEEFHAWELFGGFGIYDGVPQDARFEVINDLLHLVARFPILYGAVNVPELRKKSYGSADPVDIAFRICATGISEWALANVNKNATLDCVILIVDDTQEKAIKNALKTSFRQIRPRMKVPLTHGLSYLHDDMYFGDSKSSVGLQLADLCSYFIARHLEGHPEVEGFYKIIEKGIVHGKVEPE